MPQTPLVIYHKDCIDGTAAAAVVLRKFPNAQTFPLHHGYSAEDLQPVQKAAQSCDNVYTVDCAMGAKELTADGYPVTIIDHHAGMQHELTMLTSTNKNVQYIFDNNKSGASLTWSHLFPDEPTPEIILYIEDIDLWRWRFGTKTKHVANYVRLFKNLPEKVVELFSRDIKEILKDGALLSAYEDSTIRTLIEVESLPLRIGNFTIPAFNVGVHVSSTGNLLSEQEGKAVALYVIRGSEVQFSFRSYDTHTPSALTLAQLLGGNGHKNAAGARIPLAQFLELLTSTP